MTVQPFVLYDAHAVRMATGRDAVNLRELLTALREVDGAVLRHHLFRFPLDLAYDVSAFGHEFAYWAESGLQDSVLAERLGNFDPYLDPQPEALRAALVEIVEDHLMAAHHVPWVRPGRELHFQRSLLVAYPTGVTATDLAGLQDAVCRAAPGAIYYHFFEARTRLDGRSDDFSAWVDGSLGLPEVAAAMRRIDFPAMRIEDVRDTLARLLGEATTCRQR